MCERWEQFGSAGRRRRRRSTTGGGASRVEEEHRGWRSMEHGGWRSIRGGGAWRVEEHPGKRVWGEEKLNVMYLKLEESTTVCVFVCVGCVCVVCLRACFLQLA